MKLLKQVATMFVVMVFCILLMPIQAQASETVTVNSFEYTITDGVAVLTGYSGSSSSITIPTSMTYNGVTYKIRSIGKKAFEGNTTLKTLVIPNGITSIGNGAFRNCTSLSSITINGDIGDCNSYSTWDTDYSVFYNVGANVDSLTVTFGSSVTYVPAYLFATPSSQSDGYYAHITSVTLSDKITQIGAYAFYNCYDLSSITWGSALTTISSHAFTNDSSLKTISLPSKVTSVGAYAFDSCTGITKLTLPKATASLGNGAFRNCTSLNSITINGDIGDCNSYSTWDTDYSVFYNVGANADSLKVTFGSSVTSIPAYLFATPSSKSDGYYAHITSVSVSTKATVIGTCAFYNCYDLTSVTLNCSAPTIGNYAFNNVTAKVYYASPNATWTSSNRLDYGGILTWKAKFMTGSKVAIKSISNTSTGIKITWSKVSSATGYYIYRKTSGGSYSKIKTISTNSTVSYTDTSAKAGTKYYYYVKGYNSSVTSAAGTSKNIKRLTAGKVSSVSNTSSGIKITWSKVTGASGYYVYRKTASGSYSKIATVKGATKVSYVDKSGSSGKKYTYCVKAYSGSSTGTYTTTKSTYCLYAPVITSASSNGSTKITVKWKKRSGVTGYQIQYSTSKSFPSSSKTVKVSGESTLTKTLTGLTKGKTYYIRIRSYKTASSKTYYSAWGSTKTIKSGKSYTASIPSGSYSYNGHYYYVYSGKADSWSAAKTYCSSKGGYLAVISSAKENSVLYSYVTSKGYKSVYFGYTDSASEGTWKWVSGESSSYTNWAENEPNSENSSEDYAMFYYKYTDGTWNDGNFTDTKVFLCEWKP